MAHTPSPIVAAAAELKQSLKLDPLKASWGELDAAIRTQLGGEFDAHKVAHRRMSLNLGAVIGMRLANDTGAFWFAQRDSMGALALGFPEAVFSVSPFSVSTLALVTRTVPELEQALAKIREDAAAAKKEAPAPKPLTPEDYQRYFDPGFIEFFVLDAARAESVWNLPPQRIIGELKDAFFRAMGLSREGRAAVETQLIAPLQTLDQQQPLIDQAERAPRLIEHLGNLWGGLYGTGATSEEGWNEVAARVLIIGAPASPTPTAEAAAKAGQVGPFTLWLRTVPPQPDAPKGGILGIFPPEAVRPPHPKLSGVPLRLAAFNPRALLPLLQKYDQEAVKRSVAAYGAALGAKAKAGGRDGPLQEQTLAFLDKLRDTLAIAIEKQQPFCVRRLTESEAAQSSTLGPLRAALRG